MLKIYGMIYIMKIKEKFEKKFEQLVPKIICKHIETQFKEVAFWVDALSQEKYWENII